MDKIEALKKTELFGELSDSELGALANRALEHRLRAGQLLFVAGDEAKGLYVVVEGAVRAFRESVEGREQVIHVERAGTTFAEVPVFDNGVYPSTVAAEEDTVLLFIAKADVRRLILERPTIGLAALKLLSGRLRRCAELVEALSLREVDQRLARFLVGELKSRGVTSSEGLKLDLVLTNQQIASRIGTVREVVSRALTRLQQNGLIKLDGRQIVVLNESALEVYAGD